MFLSIGYYNTHNVFTSVFQGSLVSPNHEEYEYMCDIIKDRIEEGQGETIYEIGTGGIV